MDRATEIKYAMEAVNDSVRLALRAARRVEEAAEYWENADLIDGALDDFKVKLDQITEAYYAARF